MSRTNERAEEGRIFGNTIETVGRLAEDSQEGRIRGITVMGEQAAGAIARRSTEAKKASDIILAARQANCLAIREGWREQGRRHLYAGAARLVG